jgi:hypothetical protein
MTTPDPEPRRCWWCDGPIDGRRRARLVKVEGTSDPMHQACARDWKRAQHFRRGRGPAVEEVA